MKPCVDHTGREFRSFTAMAEAWGLPPNNVRTRLRMGWELERALATPRRGGKGTLEAMIRVAKQRAQHGLCDDAAREEWASVARWLEELRTRRNKERAGGDDGALL